MSAPVDGKVYFAACHAPDGYDMKVIKIGCSGDPEKRVQMVQTGQPFECRLLATMPGDMYLEYFVHMWLRADHISGEFFHHRGETASLIAHVAKYGTHPFPIKKVRAEGMFRTLDVVQFMERHGITIAHVKKLSGATCNGYDNLLKQERCGNRRFLAALSVTAVKRGISISWPDDFRTDQLVEARAA